MGTLLDGGHLPFRIEHWWEEGRRHGVEYRYPLLDMRVVEARCEFLRRSGLTRAETAIFRNIVARHVETQYATGSAKVEPDLDRLRGARQNL